jgi:hypothetical protein
MLLPAGRRYGKLQIGLARALEVFSRPQENEEEHKSQVAKPIERSRQQASNTVPYDNLLPGIRRSTRAGRLIVPTLRKHFTPPRCRIDVCSLSE